MKGAAAVCRVVAGCSNPAAILIKLCINYAECFLQRFGRRMENYAILTVLHCIFIKKEKTSIVYAPRDSWVMARDAIAIVCEATEEEKNGENDNPNDGKNVVF